eukprot:COSAG05_NODE_26_length_29797_cov_35.911139_6_plen_315_part_00
MKNINSCTCAHINFVLNFPTRRIQLQRVDTTCGGGGQSRDLSNVSQLAGRAACTAVAGWRWPCSYGHFGVRTSGTKPYRGISRYGKRLLAGRVYWPIYAICHVIRWCQRAALSSKQFDSAAVPEGWAAGGGRREDAETEGPTPTHTASGQRQRTPPARRPGTGGIATTFLVNYRTATIAQQHQHRRIHRLCVPPPPSAPPLAPPPAPPPAPPSAPSSAPLHARLPVLSDLRGSPCPLVACLGACVQVGDETGATAEGGPFSAGRAAGWQCLGGHRTVRTCSTTGRPAGPSALVSSASATIYQDLRRVRRLQEQE